MENQRYQKGKIYRITDIGYNKCYIGSTIELLSARLSKHRNNYTHYLKGKYNFTTCFNIFEEYGVEFCKIELIEIYPCSSREELQAREGYYIRSEDCVNKVIVGRTRKEYYTDTQEHILAYAKNNKTHLKEYSKEYRETHREQLKQTKHDYYENNKEEILSKSSKPFECECGAKFTEHHKVRHLRSTKHLKLMEIINRHSFREN